MSSHRRSAEGKDGRRSSSSGGDSNPGGGPTKILNSAYYREKFGSQSPEEYKSLRLTNIDPKVSGEDLRDILEKIFKRYGDMHTKVVRQMDPYERICYVNFDFSEDCREAKRRAGAKIQQHLGKKVRMDPANVVRDQSGKFLQRFGGPPPPGGPYEPFYGGGGGGGGRARSRSPPPPPAERFRRYDSYDRYPREADRHRRRSPSYHRRSPPMTGGGGGHGPSPPPRPRPTWHYSGESDDDDDTHASRTLFVGNLELDISTNELRRYFERYGTVEEIDIKTPHEAITAYAFVRFADILSAREARKACSGEYLRDNRCKIGWGKPIFSRRLWVGGLGPDTSLAWLEKEFDRFGAIEKIDFVRGDNHAYVLFSNQEAAIEAWKKFKGLKMKNGVLENSIQVDFTDASMYDGSATGTAPNRNGRPASPRRESDHYRRGSKSPRSSPIRDRGGSGVKRRRSLSSSSAGSRDRSPRRKREDPPRTRRDSPPVKRPKEPKARSPPAPAPIDRQVAKNSNSQPRSTKMPSSSPPPPVPPPKPTNAITSAAEFAAQTLDELYQLRSPIWTGVLVLKRSAYPLQLYKLAGDDDLVDLYMRNERGESVQLNVGQRLKLDQPRTGEILRVSASAMEHSAYLLAVPNPNVQFGDDVKLADLQSRPLKLLVKYFKEKEAAGVVNTAFCPSNVPIGSSTGKDQFPTTGVLYSFPKCTYSDDFVATLCPKLSIWQHFSDECLLLVLQKGNS